MHKQSAEARDIVFGPAWLNVMQGIYSLKRNRILENPGQKFIKAAKQWHDFGLAMGFSLAEDAETSHGCGWMKCVLYGEPVGNVSYPRLMRCSGCREVGALI